MKNMTRFYIVLVMLGTLSCLSACEKAVYVDSSEGQKTQLVNSSTSEFCYQGVVYVHFSYGDSGWGGAKFNQDGKIITCDKENKKISQKILSRENKN